MSTEPPNKRTKMENDNPYLAHLSGKGASSATGSGSGSGSGSNGVAPSTSRNPLNGLVPRNVTVAQAKSIMVSVDKILLADIPGRRCQPV